MDPTSLMSQICIQFYLNAKVFQAIPNLFAFLPHLSIHSPHIYHNKNGRPNGTANQSLSL
jgi:hypothetical protein